MVFKKKKKNFPPQKAVIELADISVIYNSLHTRLKLESRLKVKNTTKLKDGTTSDPPYKCLLLN